jgi:hypothetical protein
MAIINKHSEAPALCYFFPQQSNGQSSQSRLLSNLCENKASTAQQQIPLFHYTGSSTFQGGCKIDAQI